jgi:hypothetical protein
VAIILGLGPVNSEEWLFSLKKARCYVLWTALSLQIVSALILWLSFERSKLVDIELTLINLLYVRATSSLRNCSTHIVLGTET